MSKIQAALKPWGGHRNPLRDGPNGRGVAAARRRGRRFRPRSVRDDRLGLQIFSKLFPNFLQTFGGFLQTFPNFCLAVLGNFKGLEGRKFCERPFPVSQNFFSQKRLAFPHTGAPTVAVEVNRGAVFISQTAEIHPTTYFEKQNALGDFFCWGVGGQPLRRIWRSFGDGASAKSPKGGERTFLHLISAPRNALILLMSIRVAKFLNYAPLEV